MSKETAEMVRYLERECTRRNIDISRAVIFAAGGTIYMTGSIKKIRGYTFDLKHEMEVISRVVRSKPHVQGVVLEVEFRD